MGKKNKNRNQQTNNHSQQMNSQQVRPKVAVDNLILTVEERALIEETIAKADEYAIKKEKEADAYYDERKEEANKYYSYKVKEADSLKDKNDETIQKEVDKVLRQKDKEMKDKLDKANREAAEIIKSAEDAAKEISDKVNSSEEQLSKKLADFRVLEISYREDYQKSIQNQLNLINSDKKSLEREVEKLSKSLEKSETEKANLEKDNEEYVALLSSNSIKRNEIIELKEKTKILESDYQTINKIYKEVLEDRERLNAEILKYGHEPEKAIKKNAELQLKLSKLESILSSQPSMDDLEKLRIINKNYEFMTNELNKAKEEKNRLESDNFELNMIKDEVENYRKFIKLLKSQKEELQKELERNIQIYNTTSEKVFASLSLIDNMEITEYPKKIGANLKELCENFRIYCANRKTDPLYYDEKTIRTFISGFASSRMMILEGLSGTGKSSLPRVFSEFIGSKTIEVPVQSSWKDRNDLLGFYNDFKKQYKETEFLKALYTATYDQKNIYIIVLDEMNLSRIEYYFADLLSVLERPIEYWKVELISDYASITNNVDSWPRLIKEGKLQIGDNTWFVGTANNDDSVSMITDKVYDRSVIINFDKKGERRVEQVKTNVSIPIGLNNSDFQNLLIQASKSVDKKTYDDFTRMIKFLDEKVNDLFQITFGNRTENQLEKFIPAYISCGGTFEEAIDIMFNRKVMRKLENLFDESTKASLEILSDLIKEKYTMPITLSSISKMLNKF